MGMNAWREKPSDDSKNRHRRCGHDVLGQTVPGTSSSNRKGPVANGGQPCLQRIGYKRTCMIISVMNTYLTEQCAWVSPGQLWSLPHWRGNPTPDPSRAGTWTHNGGSTAPSCWQDRAMSTWSLDDTNHQFTITDLITLLFYFLPWPLLQRTPWS